MTPDADTGHGLERERVKELLGKATPGSWETYNRGRDVVAVKTPDFINDDGAEESQLVVEGRIWSDADHVLIAAAPDLARWGLEQHARADAEAGRAARAEGEVEMLRGALEWANSAMRTAMTHLDSVRNVRAFDELSSGLEVARAALAPRPEAGAQAGEEG